MLKNEETMEANGMTEDEITMTTNRMVMDEITRVCDGTTSLRHTKETTTV